MYSRNKCNAFASIQKTLINFQLPQKPTLGWCSTSTKTKLRAVLKPKVQIRQ